MFPDIGEVNKHQQLWISEWGVRPWSFLLCARHCYVHEMQMKRYCLWEEMSSGTVLGDISPECSFPVLLYFNKVVSAREEAVWVFPPKVLGLEGQRAVRNMDGPLSSGKRSVPVAMMWKITPVGKLQGPRRVAGWCQTDRQKRRPLRKEWAGWEQEFHRSRCRKAGADQAVFRNRRWVNAGSEGLSVRMGLKRADGRGATEMLRGRLRP